jgi:hypothetical protein
VLEISNTGFGISKGDGVNPGDSQNLRVAGRECAGALALLERVSKVEGSVCQVEAKGQVPFGKLGRKRDRLLRIGERLVKVLTHLCVEVDHKHALLLFECPTSPSRRL